MLYMSLHIDRLNCLEAVCPDPDRMCTDDKTSSVGNIGSYSMHAQWEAMNCVGAGWLPCG